MEERKLKPYDVQLAFSATLFVFGIQLLLITFVAIIIFTPGEFKIILPDNLQTLGARFVCVILMNLQVEGDIRQGLKLMKYVTNHPLDFMTPRTVFSIGLMQFVGGFAAEFFCVLYLASLEKSIDVIIRYVALASIAKVDDIYFSALAKTHPLKKVAAKKEPLIIDTHRRDVPQAIEDGKIKDVFTFKVQRAIYKTFRLVYTSFIFYFLPFLVVVVPYWLGESEK
jgi:hypothetical protein